MNTPQNFSFTDYNLAHDTLSEDEIFFNDLVEDNSQDMGDLIDPLWDDFLCSELDLEEALSMGYMNY